MRTAGPWSPEPADPGPADGCAAPRRDRQATEARILAEAARLFAEQGYRAATVRAIAAAAGVNLSLINRYYGSKLGLFDAVLTAERRLPALADVPLDELPRHLAEYALRPLGPDSGHSLTAAIRASAEAPEIRELLRERLENLLIGPLSTQLPGPEARSRAVLCAAVLSGTGTVRRLLAADGPTGPELLHRLTEVFRTCLS